MRISVSLCCTSGCSMTVTWPAMGGDVTSEDGAVGLDADRRAAAGAQLGGDGAAGGPGATLEDAGQRQLLGGLVEALAHEVGDAIEQRDGERAPLDHDLGAGPVDRL